MTRRASSLRRALAALLLGAPLAAATVSGDSRAQAPPAPLPPAPAPRAPKTPAAQPAVGTPDEDEAFALYREEKYLTARTRAQAILDRDPRSIVGHFVLGSVLREAEGSLPRSMAHLREAKRLYDDSPSAYNWGDDGRYKLGAAVLWSLQATAKLMERYDEALRYLDEYDARYKPKLTSLHAWPLMKLRRFDEARAFVREALTTGTPAQQNHALNALCAVEGEDHRRQPAYDACVHAFEMARARGAAEIAPHAHNASGAALGLLRFDEAERFALAGTQRLERSPSNPWRTLALLYAGEGRADEAVAALREMERWCAAQPPEYRDQKSAETFTVIASVLLAAGEGAMGLHFVGRALDRPDRRAITSSNPEQSLGGGALLRRALLRLDAEQARERGSARGVRAEVAGIAEALGRGAEAWPDDERVAAVLADDESLVLTIRPYMDGGLEPAPTWQTGDLVDLLGPGVVSAALSRARRADADLPGAAAYFDALDAEVALARGDLGQALALAVPAIDALPRAEALLRARVAAVGAEAARRSGRVGESLALFEKALSLDPGVVRRLGLAIPARVESAGGPSAARAAALIRRSPRLVASPSGFVVHVEGDAGSLRACLLTPSAAALGCGAVTADPGETPFALAARLADDFHRAAFTMKFSLTPTDLRSLDGSTTMAQGTAREALRGLLGDGPPGDEER